MGQVKGAKGERCGAIVGSNAKRTIEEKRQPKEREREKMHATSKRPAHAQKWGWNRDRTGQPQVSESRSNEHKKIKESL